MISTIPIYVWVVGAGIAGVATLALLLYFRKDRPGKLVFQWNGRIIVGKEKEELPDEILSAMREAGSPYISASELVIWNAGLQSIRGSEIDSGEPLRVTMAPAAKILRILLRCKTNDAISFDVRQDPEHSNVALCSFDSLAPGEGVRLQFLETGVIYGVNVNGAIKGLPGGIINWERGPIGDPSGVPTSWTARYTPQISTALVVTTIAFIPVVLLIKKARHGHDPDFQLVSSGDWLRMLYLIFWCCWVVRSAIAQQRMRYGRYPKRLADQ